MFDFTLHARTRCYFLFHKHVLFVFLFYCFQQKKKKKFGEKMQNFILMAFQILYALLLDISVYCALIEHAYI
jgi:hypothetical protein